MSKFELDSWKPAVNISTWLLMITAIFVAFARLGTKYWIIRWWSADDYLCIVSVVICIAQSVALSMATANGYGDHYDSLSETSHEGVMKSQYAATILFITSMGFSKLSFIHIFWSVTPFHPDRHITAGLEIITTLWTVAGIFTAAFQCKPPRTWDYLNGQCINRRAWWNCLCVMNILTDAVVMAHGIFIVARLQMRLKRKIVLTIIFGLHILVIAAIVGQIVYVNETIDSTDQTSGTSLFTISTQVAQCLSIITCCSPQFKPFLDNLRSLGIRVDGNSRHGGSDMGYKHSTTPSHKPQEARRQLYELATIPPFEGSCQTAVTASGSKRDWDAGSESSQAYIIREVRTWAVEESVRDPLPVSLH
ncbi:hypothetical protein ETB97_008701 [Aspergillus alliaceus]|uniref:Rhodopsin domain-containing protein n=1 Tax=Petromyces alliaceus TaxID=209559 RepID=A0A8H6EBW8_PETAA|nr:hypothetical protein ETB97_008701 [Aspergillus burnettii]